MIARFRTTVLTRLVAPLLLLGLALGVAAPVRAAQVQASSEARLAALLAHADAAHVEAAIRTAAERTTTPDAFAAEVARLLAQEAGAPSPASQALLQALFGRLFQALRLDAVPHAVLVASAPTPATNPVSGHAVATVSATETPAPARVGVAVRPEPTDTVVVPRETRPAVQPLGP